MTDRTTELAFELADETARSDVECICGIENEGGYRWYDTGTAADPEYITVLMRAIEYLEARGMLIRHSVKAGLVRMQEPTIARPA